MTSRTKRTTAGAFVVLGIVSCGLPIMPAAVASPVNGRFVDDARGDALAEHLLTRELGDQALFPIGGAVDYHTHRHHAAVGVPNDGVANDWTVHIKNLTGQSWTNLFFVADAGATIGNADGVMEDVTSAPGVFTDAFRVDATGSNPNLLWESIAVNGIFEPGEEWEFAVANFGTGINSLPPMLISPGTFSGSSPMAGIGGTNSSLLASPVPVPEPRAGLVLLLASAATMLRRRPRQ